MLWVMTDLPNWPETDEDLEERFQRAFGGGMTSEDRKTLSLRPKKPSDPAPPTET